MLRDYGITGFPDNDLRDYGIGSAMMLCTGFLNNYCGRM